MISGEWYEWNSREYNFKLHNFIREYNHNEPDVFMIYLDDGDVYECVLELSSCFKGLMYIIAENVKTKEVLNLAVGDDAITHWKPPYEEPTLMVG